MHACLLPLLVAGTVITEPTPPTATPPSIATPPPHISPAPSTPSGTSASVVNSSTITGPVLMEPLHAAPGPFAPDWLGDCCTSPPSRGFLESDHAFPGFIGPISNPILSKDPRSLTEARALFIHNVVDASNPVGLDTFQAYALQVRLALTERLAFIADKDGYAVLNDRMGDSNDGWLNVAAGLKYAFVRDVEQQMLLTGGFMYEIPNGEADVFQGQGDGLFTVFSTFGKEVAQHNHFLATVGYQFPLDGNQNASFWYTSLHVDRHIGRGFYPLLELNWFHYTSGGDRGIPGAIGDGDGLINIGTDDLSGNDLVTMAVGLKAVRTRHCEIGTAWEFPLSPRHDLINNRLTVELILRY